MRATPEQIEELYRIVESCHRDFRQDYRFPTNADRLLSEISAVNRPLEITFCIRHRYADGCRKFGWVDACDIRTFVEKIDK